MTDDSEVLTYFHTQVLPCSFVEGMHATQAYEEMVFSPRALSKSKAFNFSWDFNRNLPIPISALARLVFLCVPIGMATYIRRLGAEEFNEKKRFFGVLLTGRTFDTEYQENESYRSRRKKDATFGEAIIGLFQENGHKAEQLQRQYTFVELHSEYSSKKTLLEYYHLPSYMVKYLQSQGKRIENIRHREQRDTFLRQVLQGHDPKLTLFEILRLAIVTASKGGDSRWLATDAKEAAHARVQWMYAKRGEDNVQDARKQDKLVNFVFMQGLQTRHRMVKSRQAAGGEEPYRASGAKKLESIAYRLLNAAKAGDRQEFMDSVFRVYMSAGRLEPLPVPSTFLGIFKQEGLDFETIASAFIAGLLGENYVDKEEKTDTELKPAPINEEDAVNE